jgi:hypothetical protein
MKIRAGFEITYDFVARTPMMLMLNVHPSRAADLIKLDQLRVSPAVPFTRYLDAFGNVCTRLVAPPGQLEIFTDALVADSGLPDPVEPAARQHEIAELPHDALVFLLASRYCETERLMEAAWSRFGQTPLGWARVQATSSIPTCASAISTPALPRPRPTSSSSAAACAATLPISRSRCAAA